MASATNAIREKAGVVEGEQVEIELELDETGKRWVAEAKRPETRERRAAQTVEKLKKPS